MDFNQLSRRNFLAASAAFSWASALPAWAANSDNPKRPKLAAKLRAIYETPEGLATDSVWCRRAYLDLAGRIPTADEARAFVANQAADKRERLVDGLLASEDFADYWAMRYCDILRVKSEFPINLWPNAVYVYHRRIRESLVHDESWLDFARALLTTTGSNFRDAEANFLRASAKRTPEGLSEAASLTFLGEASPKYAEYFASVRIKDTREWKEEIVYLEPGGKSPAQFADLLAGELNDRFAAAHASRVWQWLFVASPAPERAAELAAQFRAADYRLKPFLRQLTLSADYARGSITGGFPLRRLDAEVLDDAICALTGSKRDFQSIAPEPFTFLPSDRKSVLIEDGSISNAFLILFGRPARDSGLLSERRLEVTAKQRLYLFNSGLLFTRLGKITDNKDFRNHPFQDQVSSLYWRFLGRAPAPQEIRLIVKRFQDPKLVNPNRWRFIKDVAWCLLNSREFLFRG